MSRRRFFIVAGLITALASSGCSHLAPGIKVASTRQAEQLEELDKYLASQDIAKMCADSEKAAQSIEKQIEDTRKSGEERIQKLFQEEMELVQQVRAAGKQDAANKSEAIAMQALVSRTTVLQTGLAEANAILGTERTKCRDAVDLVRDVIRHLAISQKELDKVVQTDGRSPIETFVASLSFVKPLQIQLQRKVDSIQTKFEDVSSKVSALGQAIK